MVILVIRKSRQWFFLHIAPKWFLKSILSDSVNRSTQGLIYWDSDKNGRHFADNF